MKKCPHCGNIITPLTSKIFNYCKHRTKVTVKDVSRKFKISEQSANNYLSTLWLNGFVKRKSENIIGGGLRYVYYTKLKMWL